jgi:hypothetical protein
MPNSHHIKIRSLRKPVRINSVIATPLIHMQKLNKNYQELNQIFSEIKADIIQSSVKIIGVLSI